MNSLKDQVEAILFASGRKMKVEEISKLCRVRDIEQIKAALKELQQKYEAENSSLVLVGENDIWNLTVRERYLPIVQKIVSETELPKSVIETLAVIAWKSPVLQSEIIRVRTNKAYDHIHQLEDLGFITAKKHGRTKEIKLGDNFYKYFDVQGEKAVKDAFNQVKGDQIKALEEKKRLEKDAKKKAEQAAEQAGTLQKPSSEQVKELVLQAKKELEAETAKETEQQKSQEMQQEPTEANPEPEALGPEPEAAEPEPKEKTPEEQKEQPSQ